MVLQNSSFKSALGKMGLSNPFLFKREPAILLLGKFCGGPCMVVMQCPHCSLEVELDDGASGLFDCPHCGEEFQWGEMDKETDWTQANSVAWVLLVAVTLILILFWIQVSWQGFDWLRFLLGQ